MTPADQRKLDAFGRAIQKGRRTTRLSQSALARLAQISPKTQNNIESGRNWPSVPVYFALCEALGADKPPFAP